MNKITKFTYITFKKCYIKCFCLSHYLPKITYEYRYNQSSLYFMFLPHLSFFEETYFTDQVTGNIHSHSEIT